MSDDYTPLAVRHDTITTITDDDVISAAAVSVPLEELADNIESNTPVACYTSDLTTSASGAKLSLNTVVYEASAYFELSSLSFSALVVGKYQIDWSFSVKASDTTANLGFAARLNQISNTISKAATTRFSATATHYVHLSGSVVANVTDVSGGVETDSVFSLFCDAAGTITPYQVSVVIRKVPTP